MSKHTDGPWRRGRKHNSIVADSPAPGIRGSDDVEAYGGHMICESVNEPNGSLIIAATDMLEALEAIVEHAKSMQDAWDADGNQPNTKMHGLAVCLNNRAGDLIERAIAKAKGETP